MNKNIKDIIVGKILKEAGIRKVKVMQNNKYMIKVMCENRKEANNIVNVDKFKKSSMMAFIPTNIIIKQGVIYNVP